MSADGRIVVFTSLADNLVPGDTNGVADVFAYDRETRKVTRVSVDPNGGQFIAASSMPAISPEGTRIALATSAANFSGSGTQAVIALSQPSIDVNRWIPGLTAISSIAATTDSIHPMVASAGALVLFQSQAGNLVAGDANDRDDFFSYRPSSGGLERLVTGGDARDFVVDNCIPRLNADGSTLSFCGHVGTAQKNVSVTQIGMNRSEWVGKTSAGVVSTGACHSPALSAAGDVVAFIGDADDLVSGDTNGLPDVFVRDLESGVTTRVSLMNDGTQSAIGSISVGISGNGRWVLSQWGNVAGPTPETTYGGVSLYDRLCGVPKTFFIATEIGTVGSEMRFEEISLSQDGTTIVGTVTNVRSPDSISQVMLVRLDGQF